MTLTYNQIEALRYLKSLPISFPEEIKNKTITFELIESESAYLAISLDDQVKIIASQENLFYRGLFILIPKMIKNDKKSLIEETPIKEVSYSLDASRNGVMKVSVVKKFISYLATLGFNTLYLYTEDTYEVKGLDYFGYLRGAYKEEEIKEIVQFAKLFGMEVVPSIQTLAHLTQFLKWYPVHQIMDDGNTLLIGEEKTYEAIEKMIIACKEMYDSNRIHLGMDEAYQAGLGRYLELYGHTSRVDLMISHINRVSDIVKKHNMVPLIWSDFIYKLLDKNNGKWLYDINADIDTEKAKELPTGLTYVHWDYGGEDIAKYEIAIENHFKFCDTSHYILAGGAHIWNRLAPNHGKSLKTIEASIQACRNKQVKSVMLTTWGDDGQETDHWHSFVSAVYYVQAIYATIDHDEVQTIYDQLFGAGSFNLMSTLQYIDEVESVIPYNSNMTNISKLLLWQDPLLGIYDYHVEKHNEKSTHSLSNYYQELSKKLSDCSFEDNNHFALIQEHYTYLTNVLSVKSELGVNLRDAYLTKDQETMQQLQEEILPHLIELMNHLKHVHYKMWHYTYKANGWEIIEMRYAGVVSRLDMLTKKISAYLHGNDMMEELKEERKPFSEYTNPIEISGFNYRGTSGTGYN